MGVHCLLHASGHEPSPPRIDRRALSLVPRGRGSDGALLVEDDLTIASRLAELFTQQAGYQVIVASVCLTALKFIRLCTPALMLLDERLLTSKGIDLGPRLFLMKGLQAQRVSIFL